MNRVVIVGGGISGLATAYYLSRAGCACTLIDPAPRLGGVISTASVDGCLVEKGPDSFLAQKPWALQLIRELGLEQEVIGSQDHLRKTYIVRRGRLVPMPDGLYLMVPTAIRPMLTARLVGLATKCRMGLDLLRRPGRLAPDRSAADLVRDHYGQEAVEYLAEPLLAGIYGGEASQLSANSVLPRLVEFERRYGSLTRGVLASRPPPGDGTPSPLFLTLKRGMQQLTDALAQAITGSADVIRAEAEQVLPAGGGYRVRCPGVTIEAEQVVVATSAGVAGALLRAVNEQISELLSQIRYHSSITVALGYDRSGFRHPLNGFGFLTPQPERGLMTACTWVGTKFPHRVREDRVLLRAFVSAGSDETLLARPDDSLVASLREELHRLMGVTEAPLFSLLHRWPRAMAQYTVGHERRLAEIQARLAGLPGLHLAGNAYLGIGIPDCIHSAQLAAARIAGTA